MSSDLTRGQIDGAANAPVKSVPKLRDLTPEQKRSTFNAAVKQRLVREMDEQITALSEDFGELVDEFLRTRKSEHTRRRYHSAIAKWTGYCFEHSIHPLLATPKDADLWAAQLAGAAASVNSDICGVSSLYATLYKWGKIARTPFVKIARRAEESRQHRIPSAKEVRIILEASR